MTRDRLDQKTVYDTRWKMTEFGRSVIEMLGVLAVMGLISVLGISFFSTARAKNRANTAMQHVSMASINLRLSLGGQAKAKFDIPNSDVSLANAGGYKNAGIVVDFKEDVQACRQFMSMYEKNSEYYVLNKCEEE